MVFTSAFCAAADMADCNGANLFSRFLPFVF
jgi:hypothetical protein